jgi:hypothetical protein
MPAIHTAFLRPNVRPSVYHPPAPHQLAAIVLALLCAVVLGSRVYLDFERVRVRLITTPYAVDEPTVHVRLPDLSKIGNGHPALVVHLRGAAEEASVSIALGDQQLTHVDLSPRAEVRLDLQPEIRESHDVNLTLTSDRGGWEITYLEVANVHGFTRGPLAFQILPEAAPAGGLPWWLAATTFVVLAVARPRVWCGRVAVRTIHAAGMTLALALLALTLLLPVFSPFKVILALHTFLGCVIVLYAIPLADLTVGFCWSRPVRTVCGAFWHGVSVTILMPRRLWARIRSRLLARRSQPLLLSRSARWSVAVFSAVMVVVLVAGIVVLRGSPQGMPTSDGAVLELYTLHALKGTWPLGPYSRFQWNHPGPSFFYLVAPWYWLSGQHHGGLNVGAFAINISSLLAILYILFRHRAGALALSLSALLLAFVTRCGPLVISAWNPHTVLLPFAALLVTSAAACNGDRVGLVLMSAIASLVGQTYVGLLPVAFVISATSFVLWAIRGRWSRPEWDAVAAIVCVLGVFWTLPLLEEWTNRPGNVTKIASFFLAKDGSSLSWHEAVQIWSTKLTAPFSAELRIPIGHAVGVTATWPIVSAAAVLPPALLAVAWPCRRRQPLIASMALLVCLASIVALLSVVRIRGEVMDQTVFWIAVIGLLGAAALAAAGLAWIRERLGSRGREWNGVAATVLPTACLLGIVAFGASHFFSGGEPETPPEKTTVGRAFSELVTALESVKAQSVGVEVVDWYETAGVVLQMYKADVPVRVEPAYGFMFGAQLVASGDEEFWFAIAERGSARRMAAERGGCVLLEFGAQALYVPPRGSKAAAVCASSGQDSR